MKINPLFIIVVLCLASLTVKSQETKSRLLFVEAGMDFISCEPPEKDYIRGEVDPYAYDYEASTLRGLLSSTYIGIKTEKRVLRNKLGLMAGLRYSRMVSSIGKETYWSDTPDFFYMMFRQSGTTAEYLKVKEINQIAGYLGIPMEVRIYPYRPRTFNVYYKIGTSLNFRIHSKTNFEFVNKVMEQFENEAGEITGDPWAFYSTIHAAVGFKIGKDPKPGVNIEFVVPAAIMASTESGLVTPQAGGGFQLNFRIPF